MQFLFSPKPPFWDVRANRMAPRQRRDCQDSPECLLLFWQAALRKEAAQPLPAAAGVSRYYYPDARCRLKYFLISGQSEKSPFNIC